MEHSDNVTAFDTLFTTNHIQILKILLPCLNQSMQRQLAVYIKFLELQYTMRFFQKNPFAKFPGNDPLSENGENGANGAMELCNEILPFCSPAERDNVQNIINMYRNFANMQEMMQMLEMLREVSPELFQGMPAGSDGADIAQTMELLQSMLS